MTRIGFAYNQKPAAEPTPIIGDGESILPEDEPPSSRRDDPSRTSDSPASTEAGAAAASPAAVLPTADDHFAEWDTPETIDAVARALAPLGEVIRLEADLDFPARLRDARPDIVFNIAEGLHGPNREAHVPAICEFLGTPYSGSDPFTLSLCLDKARTKETLAYRGIPTAPFTLVESLAELDTLRTRLVATDGRPLGFPLFVKPVQEGSSKGISERSFCRDRRELESAVADLLVRYDQPVLVETFLSGAEFTCGVLGNGAAARVLPIVAMNFGALPAGALPIYGFEAKWLWDSVEAPLDIYECPARISPELRETIERVVLRTYGELRCRDWSRIDVRLDADGVPNIVEVNPLPGILPDPRDNSCLPKAARAAGMQYDELIQACLLAAAERQGIPIVRPAVRPSSEAPPRPERRAPRVAAAG